MKTSFIFFLFINLSILAMAQQNNNPPVGLVIHGGAGTILKKNMTPELEQKYRDALMLALKTGYDTLLKGGTAISACEVVIRIMEDNILFNAGKGSVFTHEGKNEMDASIMDGKTLKAGAVSGVTTIKNPISAAKTVMQKSPHVMMAGQGAEEFAKKMGLEIVDPSYFFDQHRWEQLQKIKQSEKIELDHTDTSGSHSPLDVEFGNDKKFGTVGCVALDQYGNLAAGTSTGGMTNKKHGRIGDSPIIGAGTYANNKTCAISCTGHGEYFIRGVVAYDVSALMEYKGMTLEQAGNEVVNKKLKEIGGEGGLIGMDAKGNMIMPFNTAGMYRGWSKNGVLEVFIYK